MRLPFSPRYQLNILRYFPGRVPLRPYLIRINFNKDDGGMLIYQDNEVKVNCSWWTLGKPCFCLLSCKTLASADGKRFYEVRELFGYSEGKLMGIRDPEVRI